MTTEMQEGDTVILFSANSKFNSVVLNADRKTRVFGVLKDLSGLVGQPYGSVYEMHSASDKPKRIFELTERGTARSVSEGRDNRDVSDDAANQKLSMNEIEDLKARAEDGNAIVEALIENSETYERKTEFGQEKYLSKKVRKYCTTFSTLRPTTASICETQFDWFAVKASFMRADVLSVMLSLANVGAHRRVLVVDNCMGLLTTAVAERLGGHGDICVGCFGNKPGKLETEKRFRSIPSENLDKVPLVDLIRLKERFDENPGSLSEALSETVGARSVPEERSRRWIDKGFDSCLLADWKVHPKALVEGVLPLLAPSAAFAVYSSGLTSLVECHNALMKRKDVVLVELQDLWWREFQVLPGRTRPMMDAKCPSGYVLSGIKVHYEPPP